MPIWHVLCLTKTRTCEDPGQAFVNVRSKRVSTRFEPSYLSLSRICPAPTRRQMSRRPPPPPPLSPTDQVTAGSPRQTVGCQHRYHITHLACTTSNTQSAFREAELSHCIQLPCGITDRCKWHVLCPHTSITSHVFFPPLPCSCHFPPFRSTFRRSPQLTGTRAGGTHAEQNESLLRSAYHCCRLHLQALTGQQYGSSLRFGTGDCRGGGVQLWRPHRSIARADPRRKLF